MKPLQYMPRLSKWVSDKITFWQTDLGSNLLQNNNRNDNVKRSLAVTSEYEKKMNLNFYNKNSRAFDKDHANSDDRPYSDKQGCIFCGERGHKPYIYLIAINLLKFMNLFLYLLLILCIITD